MFAVIKTGGKQYRVAANDVLKIGNVPGEVGDIVHIGEVLAHGEGDQVTIGAPLVEGAVVTAEVVSQGRAKKVIAFKKRRRQNSRRKRGHRQHETTVRIDEILLAGAKPGKKSAAKAGAAAQPAAFAAMPAVADAADDISLISGIGPVLKRKMEAAGYGTLTAISKLGKAEVEKLDDELGFNGRIEREEWVEQAKELLAGKPPRAKVDQEAADNAAAKE